MTLWELVRDLEASGRKDQTICARKPRQPESEAVLVTREESGAMPRDVKNKLKEQGVEYFLEDIVIREILGSYVRIKPRSQDEKFKFVVYYAENDAVPDE